MLFYYLNFCNVTYLLDSIPPKRYSCIRLSVDSDTSQKFKLGESEMLSTLMLYVALLTNYFTNIRFRNLDIAQGHINCNSGAPMMDFETANRYFYLDVFWQNYGKNVNIGTCMLVASRQRPGSQLIGRLSSKHKVVALRPDHVIFLNCGPFESQH